MRFKGAGRVFHPACPNPIQNYFLSATGRRLMNTVKAEIEYAYGEVPLRPNVIPVIILKGSDFELGYQYIHQVNQIFGRFFLDQMKQAKFTNEELDNIKK
jgi:hypothetical protein